MQPRLWSYCETVWKWVLEISFKYVTDTQNPQYPVNHLGSHSLSSRMKIKKHKMLIDISFLFVGKMNGNEFNTIKLQT